MKHLLARAATLLLVVVTATTFAPATAQAAGPITQCVGPHLMGTQELCQPHLDANLTQAYANGNVRVYGWVWTQRRYYGLRVNVHVHKGGQTRLIDSRTCATGSDTCTYDKEFPCSRDCYNTGWYNLDISAYSYGTWIGGASDSTYIVCG